jgi:hypothetical protein
MIAPRNPEHGCPNKKEASCRSREGSDSITHCRPTCRRRQRKHGTRLLDGHDRRRRRWRPPALHASRAATFTSTTQTARRMIRIRPNPSRVAAKGLAMWPCSVCS